MFIFAEILLTFGLLIPLTKVLRISRELVPTHSVENFTPFTVTHPPLSKFEYTVREDHTRIFSDAYTKEELGSRDGLDLRSSLLQVFFVMLGGVAIFVVICIIIKCCHEDNNDTSLRSRSSVRRIRRRSRHRRGINNLTDGHPYGPSTSRYTCSHWLCIRSGSANCILSEDEDTNDLPALTRDRHEDISLHYQPTVIVHNNHDGNSRVNHLDLPPTYGTSTSNSARSSSRSLHETNDGLSSRILNSNKSTNRGLPPSYDEAVATGVASAPPENNSTPSASPVCAADGSGGSTWDGDGGGGTCDSGGGGATGDSGGGAGGGD